MLAIAFLLGLVSTGQERIGDVELPPPKHPSVYRVYIGTYANGPDRGIALFDFKRDTGELTSRGLAAQSINPSFLAVHTKKHQFLYAVNEVDNFGGKRAGAVSAFLCDRKTGKLTLLNQQSSGGPGPCYITFDQAGKHVLVANYGGGSVAVLPVGNDGRLQPASSFIQHTGSGPNARRQEGPHAHSINLDRPNNFAAVADLGLDKVFIYKYDKLKGTLTPNDPPSVSVAASAGPRHFAFHPDGKHAYVINEMDCTVTSFDYDSEAGTLAAIQTISTLPVERQPGYSTAEIRVHPNGNYLYGSNRGHNTIAIFGIDGSSGRLIPVGHQSTLGKTPRNFAIDPSGRFILAANQDSNTVVVFKIDPSSGKLKPTGQTVQVPSPVCVKFAPID
jgi:6-phosphogluconolactonase